MNKKIKKKISNEQKYPEQKNENKIILNIFLTDQMEPRPNLHFINYKIYIKVFCFQYIKIII